MNSVELNGRPDDGWDITWMIAFEKYPALASLYPNGVRPDRMMLVEDLARAAHDNLLDLLVWSHELYLPPGFVDLYPQVRGVEYPVCLSSEFLKRFVRDKYLEFFERAPSVDGVVISINESGQFSLITDAGCKCNRCRQISREGRLRAVLDEVVAVTTRLSKQIILRTFQAAFVHDLHGHPELQTIRSAFTGLPPQVQVMSKYCPLDFYGGEIADEPLIGVFPNRHLVEFSLDVEWQGRTFIPVLTPDNFRRRIKHAVEKNCTGVVARVDFPFPSMEPEPIFGHPNDFNAFYFGELLWEPQKNADESLSNWTKLRYGAECSRELAFALRKTEAITQKTFFTLGHTVINYHNMIASVSEADANLWSHALSKWDPQKTELSESFFCPTDELIERCKTEKREAEFLAENCLSSLQNERRCLSRTEYERFECYFEKLRDTANLWNHLVELYLLHRQIAFSPPNPELVTHAIIRGDQSKVQRLVSAAEAAMRRALGMEQRYGQNSWPVFSPDRGTSAYQFVHEILRYYIAAVTGEAAADKVEYKLMDTVVTTPEVKPDSAESFWRQFVEWGRPQFQYEQSGEADLVWPIGLRELRLNERSMGFFAYDGRGLELPLPYPVEGILFSPTPRLSVKVRKTVSRIVLEQPRTDQKTG
jgi:hypothetical protein